LCAFFLLAGEYGSLLSEMQLLNGVGQLCGSKTK